MLRLFIFNLIFSVFILVGCKPGANNSKAIELDSSDLISSDQPIYKPDTAGMGLPIFYNMYLSVELSSLFETAGAVFKSDIMNSPDAVSNYITSIQQAVNLGVYAVDLSYAKVFDQAEITGRYFKAMQQIATELGIPGDFFETTTKRFERNITNKDSLIKIANEVYVTTDNYLKENERYTTAALIIVGGWVEAVYIAIDVAIESEDPEIIERLVDQKYSLNNLLTMLSTYKDNEAVNEYLTDLTRIKRQFDLLDISFEANFDPNSAKGKAYVNESIKKISKFKSLITEFRNKLIK